MGVMVSQPTRPHYCHIDDEFRFQNRTNAIVGSVWLCECGQYWRVVFDHENLGSAAKNIWTKCSKFRANLLIKANAK